MSAHHPLSFEFFPPKTSQGEEKLVQTCAALSRYQPDFFSVTYGAGGSTRDNTRDTVLRIQATGQPVAPHLSFGGAHQDAIRELLGTYQQAGIRRLVALRGDLPSGMGGATHLVHANKLVAFIREHFGDFFCIHVAAYPEIHPEAKSYGDDIHWLRAKFAAGANAAITQYFYNADAYFYFVEQCQKSGIEQPIVPGIMPISNVQNLLRFSANCGAEIPRWLQQRLRACSDDPADVLAFGCEVVTRLCEKLLAGGAPGLHFYTMNQSQPTSAIVDNLNMAPPANT